ncbi:MAG TPA: hypothetical protein VGS10_10690 [Terracidiphilus sp.]|nr:hypothetical protein [Terracidiphilus sp.]
MTLTLHLQIVGALLLLLAVCHAFFNRYFKWSRELAGVSLFTRRVFFVHAFFIALTVALAGAGSILYAGALLQPNPLSRAILAALVTFWLCRLFAQFFAYDAVIWRGNRFRTSMHVFFSVLWCYVTVVYGVALIRVWRA